jgi:hypothetical protein
MGSGVADPDAEAWERLHEAARGAARSREGWRGRALEAEREVLRLRHELELLSAEDANAAGSREELVRLRAENALLSSRTAEARQRVAALLARLAVLERTR